MKKMKRIKRYVMVPLCSAILLWTNVSVYAYTIQSNNGREITVQDVSENQIPEEIGVLEFNTQEEADNFLESAFSFQNKTEAEDSNAESESLENDTQENEQSEMWKSQVRRAFVNAFARKMVRFAYWVKGIPFF